MTVSNTEHMALNGMLESKSYNGDQPSTHVTDCIGNQRKYSGLHLLERWQLVFGREYKHNVGIIRG